MMKQQSRARLWCGLVVYGLIAGFTTVLIYFHEPIGDDILGYFQDSISYYLDEFEFILGPRITTLSQVFQELKAIYFYWSGRVPGYLLAFLGRLLPKSGQAIITALIYTSTVFLTMRIVHKSSRKAVSAPISALILFSSLYWFREIVFFMYMWTMTSIYSLATCLCLLYLNLAMDEQQGHRRNLCVLTIAGFLAGFSHEVISLCLIAVVGTFWLVDVIRKQHKWHTLFRHTGLGIGYLCCFFAPGNFYRIHQSHDVIETSFLYRLHYSFLQHGATLFGSKSGGIAVIAAQLLTVLAFLILILIVIKKNYSTLFCLLEQNSGFLVGGTVSILVWAMMPRVPSYGMDFWIVLAYIVLFRIINVLPDVIPSLRSIGKQVTIQITCVVLLVLSFATSSWREVVDSTTVYLERQQLIASAVAKGDTEVVIPRYPDTVSPIRFCLEYLNGQMEYDSAYYQLYYGTHLIVENPEHPIESDTGGAQ